MADKLVSRSEDFNEWYNTLVLAADLADYGPARGTMIAVPGRRRYRGTPKFVEAIRR